jgi:DNA-binding transcriptional LysR family regulator
MAPSFPGMGVIEADSRTRIPSVEVEDLTTAREIVKKSNALSGATPIQIQSWEKTGGFVVIPYRAAWFKLNYGFIYRRDRMLSPAAKAFIQKVRSIEKDIASRNSNLIKQIFAPA